MKDLNQANDYLKKRKVIKDEFRPSYHLSPTYGWCNDPHGIVYFHGVYHIFFQYNPYDTKAENVFWGHVTSKDFIHFSETTCAIAPDMPYDNSGCWSGSSIVINDKLYLVYTGFSLHDDGKYYQTVNIAESDDGFHFEKSSLNPIIDTKDIPSLASLYDFRDPCIFERDNKLYIIIGSKSRDEKEAQLLLYEGEDITHFRFLKKLVSSSQFGTMFECPNLVTFADRDYIIMSPQNIKEKNGDFANVSSCVYFPLDKDFIHKEQHLENVKEIDHGLEFYAPTVYDKEKLVVSWMQMWGRRYYLDEIRNDFINSFSLFKKIAENKDGELSFIPLDMKDCMKEVRNETVLLDGKKEISKSDSSRFRLSFDKKNNLMMTFYFFDSEKDTVYFRIDCQNNRYELDRRGVSTPLLGVDSSFAKTGFRYLNKEIPSHLEFDIYVDKNYVEIFFDDYKESFSFINFSKESGFSIESNMPLSVIMKEEKIEVK
ncbi:MAG: hypothetical protein SOR23_05155 [Candidatus Enterosoma sp.]|nr:hypothetical protein [Candidatus Enterosoma sp.]